MLCKDCEYFKINYQPLGRGKDMLDWGRASCRKYNLVTDFRTERKFKTLNCIEEQNEWKKLPHWVKENTRGKSYLFKCSECGKVVYYISGQKENICGYDFCPWCKTKMRCEDDRQKNP